MCVRRRRLLLPASASPPLLPCLLLLLVLHITFQLGQPASSSVAQASSKPQKVGYSFCPVLTPILTSSPAEALDQWFENLQNYEATLVRFSLLKSLFLQFTLIHRRTWQQPLWMSTLKKNSALLNSVSLSRSLALISHSRLCRVQGPFRGRAYRCPL